MSYINININWENDPIFGTVPEEHREWFLENSGTHWNERRKGWYITNRIEYYSVKFGDNKYIKKNEPDEKKPSHPVRRADIFQNQMINMRLVITEALQRNGKYTVSNANVFDLMRNGKTTVKVETEGQEFMVKVSV